MADVIANRSNRVMRPENAAQREAFELYASMPREQRSIEKLAPMVRMSPRSLKRWSATFHWGDRIAERDAARIDAERHQFEDQLKVEKQTYINLWRGVLRKAIKTNAEGKSEITIGPENVSDLEKATKMLLLLQGEATDRIEIGQQVIQRVFAVLNLRITDTQLRYQIFEDISQSVLTADKVVAAARMQEESQQ